MFKKSLSLFVIFCFILTGIGPFPKAHADIALGLPAPGTMINLSPAYEPVMIKGLTVHKDNPFLFDFIVDVGQDKMSGGPLKKEGEKLIKYFLASLAIPDQDLWVNLSPYEKQRIIPEALGQTDMGRDLLEQDYILKQITASLIYPEKQLGKIFWDKVYAKAQELYGTTQIPVNTFNKVWIMADKAEVFEHNQTAFVVNSHLKVMLEEDYLALKKNSVILSEAKDLNKLKDSSATPQNDSHYIASNIVRQIILPELEGEVNTGKNFANLRQIFNSIILSSWYKRNLKEALLNQVYANKSKIKGINLNDPMVMRQIYEQYLKAYKKGVFNYIKDEVNATGAAIPHKYFSGGMEEGVAANPAVTTDQGKLANSLPVDRAMVVINAGLVTNPLPKASVEKMDAAMSSKIDQFLEDFNAILGKIDLDNPTVQRWAKEPELTWQVLETVLSKSERENSYARQGAVILLRSRSKIIHDLIASNFDAVWTTLLEHTSINYERNDFVRMDSNLTLAQLDLYRAIPLLIRRMLKGNEPAPMVREVIIRFIGDHIESFSANQMLRSTLIKVRVNDPEEELKKLAGLVLLKSNQVGVTLGEDLDHVDYQKFSVEDFFNPEIREKNLEKYSNYVNAREFILPNLRSKNLIKFRLLKALIIHWVFNFGENARDSFESPMTIIYDPSLGPVLGREINNMIHAKVIPVILPIIFMYARRAINEDAFKVNIVSQKIDAAMFGSKSRLRHAEFEEAIQKIQRHNVYLENKDLNVILVGKESFAFRVNSYVLAVIKEPLTPNTIAERYNAQGLTIKYSVDGDIKGAYKPDATIYPYSTSTQISIISFPDNGIRDKFLAALKNDAAMTSKPPYITLEKDLDKVEIDHLNLHEFFNSKRTVGDDQLLFRYGNPQEYIVHEGLDREIIKERLMKALIIHWVFYARLPRMDLVKRPVSIVYDPNLGEQFEQEMKEMITGQVIPHVNAMIFAKSKTVLEDEDFKVAFVRRNDDSAMAVDAVYRLFQDSDISQEEKYLFLKFLGDIQLDRRLGSFVLPENYHGREHELWLRFTNNYIAQPDHRRSAGFPAEDLQTRLNDLHRISHESIAQKQSAAIQGVSKILVDKYGLAQARINVVKMISRIAIINDETPSIRFIAMPVDKIDKFIGSKTSNGMINFINDFFVWNGSTDIQIKSSRSHVNRGNDKGDYGVIEFSNLDDKSSRLLKGLFREVLQKISADGAMIVHFKKGTVEFPNSLEPIKEFPIENVRKVLIALKGVKNTNRRRILSQSKLVKSAQKVLKRIGSGIFTAQNSGKLPKVKNVQALVFGLMSEQPDETENEARYFRLRPTGQGGWIFYGDDDAFHEWRNEILRQLPSKDAAMVGFVKEKVGKGPINHPDAVKSTVVILETQDAKGSISKVAYDLNNFTLKVTDDKGIRLWRFDPNTSFKQGDEIGYEIVLKGSFKTPERVPIFANQPSGEKGVTFYTNMDINGQVIINAMLVGIKPFDRAVDREFKRRLKRIQDGKGKRTSGKDRAMDVKLDQTGFTRGGIDLNTNNINWNIRKDSNGVEMTVDPAKIERIRHIGIDSLSPVIYRITPLSTAQAEHLAAV